MFCIFTLFNVEWEGMRRRIKPIVVYVVLALLGLALVIANIHNTSKQQAHLEKVKSAIPSATTPKTTTQMELTNLLKHISKNSKNVTFQLPSIPTPKVLLSKR